MLFVLGYFLALTKCVSVRKMHPSLIAQVHQQILTIYSHASNTSNFLY